MNGFRKFLENKEQEEAFMRVLRSNEATYDHWLVFADSLEEKGEIEDAEMIRLLVGTDMGRVPKNEVIKRVMEIQHEDNRRQGGLRGWIDPSHPRVRTYLISPLSGWKLVAFREMGTHIEVIPYGYQDAIGEPQLLPPGLKNLFQSLINFLIEQSHPTLAIEQRWGFGTSA